MLYSPENLNPKYTGKMLSSDLNSLIELKKFYEYKNNLLNATEEPQKISKLKSNKYENRNFKKGFSDRLAF